MDPVTTRPRRRAAVGARLTSVALAVLVPGCACTGDWDIAERPSESCWESDSAVVSSASSREHDRLIELLRAGSDPDLADGGGRTALACAAMVGDLRAVEVLLVSGADPNRTGEEGGRPIVTAISGEGEWALLYDPDERNAPSERFSPLGSPDRQKIVRRLMDAGAEPLGAVAPAARLGSTEMVKIFLDAGVPLTGEPGAPSPLMMAAWSGHDDVVRQLLDADAEPDVGGDVDYAQALVSAADELPEGRFSRLSSSGAVDTLLDTDRLSADGRVESGATPLMGAVVGHHPDTVIALLGAGADPNHRLSGTIPVLWIAVAMGDAEVVSALRFAGADPDPAPTGTGDRVESPLALARALGDQQMIDLLK